MGVTDKFLQSGAIISLHEKELLIGWGKKTWLTQPSTMSPYHFYFPDFFLNNQQPWFTFEETKTVTVDELVDELYEDLLQFSSPCDSHKFLWNQPNRELYRTIFNDLKNKYLESGVLKKAVPFTYSKAVGTMTRAHITQSLLSILKICKQAPCYLYGFWEEYQGILGVTPEILFSQRRKEEGVKTVACAGTCSNNADIEAFLNNPKESMEHQYVVEGIKNSLSDYGEVILDEKRILHLPGLKHLFTPILLKPNRPIAFTALVKALHPTPALGAYPKEEGKEWLQAIQNLVDRKRFGAPVGVINTRDDSFACYVGIRNIQWNEQEISVFAGGGVIGQSEWEKEWNEIVLKIETVKKMLALETPL